MRPTLSVLFQDLITIHLLYFSPFSFLQSSWTSPEPNPLTGSHISLLNDETPYIWCLHLAAATKWTRPFEQHQNDENELDNHAWYSKHRQKTPRMSFVLFCVMLHKTINFQEVIVAMGIQYIQVLWKKVCVLGRAADINTCAQVEDSRLCLTSSNEDRNKTVFKCFKSFWQTNGTMV